MPAAGSDPTIPVAARPSSARSTGDARPAPRRQRTESVVDPNRNDTQSRSDSGAALWRCSKIDFCRSVFNLHMSYSLSRRQGDPLGKPCRLVFRDYFLTVPSSNKPWLKRLLVRLYFRVADIVLCTVKGIKLIDQRDRSSN